LPHAHSSGQSPGRVVCSLQLASQVPSPHFSTQPSQSSAQLATVSPQLGWHVPSPQAQPGVCAPSPSSVPGSAERPQPASTSAASASTEASTSVDSGARERRELRKGEDEASMGPC
jgi:hypothetical protein